MVFSEHSPVCFFFLLFKTTEGHYLKLSDDVTVIQLSTSCHNNRMNTRVITFSRVHVISLTTNIHVLTIRLFIKIIFIWLATKVIWKQSITLVVMFV